MYSVDEIIEQIDGDSEIEDNLEENSQENEETEDKDEKSDSTTKVQPKTKRKLGNRPKLDAERLKGSRGLICIEKMFSDIKFKGRGYEKQDLNQVMNNLQYWCHRLFPKFTFDDCLAQLERLGTKKSVITLRKKILYNMMEEEEQPAQYENTIDDDMPDSQQEAISQFDLLLNQHIPTSIPSTQPAVTAEVVELTDDQKEMIEKNRQLAAERRRARLEAIKQKQEENELQMSQDSQISNSPSLSLTDEQRIIIERNRLLAVEKRKQLHKQSENLSQNTEEIIIDNTESTNDHQTIRATDNENKDTNIINENQDTDVTNEKQHTEMTNDNEDQGIINENQSTDITNENLEIEITNESQATEIINVNQNLINKEKQTENFEMEVD